MITPILSLLLAVPVVSPTERAAPVVVSGEGRAHISPRKPDILPTRNILFASGVDTLTAIQKSRIRYLAKWGQGRRFHVKGYSDTTGSNKGNMEAAEKRAKAIAELLPGSTYEGVGETTSFGLHKDNRRAVIKAR